MQKIHHINHTWINSNNFLPLDNFLFTSNYKNSFLPLLSSDVILEKMQFQKIHYLAFYIKIRRWYWTYANFEKIWENLKLQRGKIYNKLSSKYVFTGSSSSIVILLSKVVSYFYFVSFTDLHWLNYENSK